MTTIVAGSAASFTELVMQNGVPVPVSGSVKASVFSMDGRTEIIQAFDLADDPDEPGWPEGIVTVDLDETQTTLLPAGDTMLVLSGKFGIKRYRLTVETLLSPTRTSLFIKDFVVTEMRNEQLIAAAAGALQDVQVSDDYIWSKVRAAESEIGHRLRVPLVPTRFFPSAPTDEQLAELQGMAWSQETPYDYTPDMFERDKWGTVVTRQRPIISVRSMRFVYPSMLSSYFDIPPDWIKLDARMGHIRIVPQTNAYLVSSAGFAMTSIAGYRSLPNMIQVVYDAGLVDVANTYPELIDAIKKQAVCKIITEAFLPQSGSISADGLSQSMSVDVGKYQDIIDHIIDGPEGSNGGLQTQINGIRAVVL